MTAGRRTLLRDLSSSDSYLSSPDPRLSFGLGAVSMVERIEVRWADGTRSTRENITANQILEIAREP